MIGPEDIQETPKTNFTPILILGIAALLLLIVGFISYRDYVNSKADARVKVSNERMRKMEQKLEQMTRGGGVQAGPNGAVASAPVAQRDPEIEELRRQLEGLRKQSESIKMQTEANSMKVEKVLNAGTGSLAAAGLPIEPGSIPPPVIRDDLAVPDYIRQSVQTPPGGYRPGATAELTDVQKRVKNAPSIGSIVSFNSDWNLVTIDAGKSNGVDVGQRYSIRRGAELMGVVKIIEVFSTKANANLVNSGRSANGGQTPQVGDEIISFKPF